MTPAASIVAAVSTTVPPGPVVVALGGGADSAVAAWAVVNRDGANQVRALFVAHGWEGSAMLEAAARRLAAQLDFDIAVVPAPVPEEAPSAEDRARRAREAVSSRGLRPGEWLVTGHSRDDLVETVLANLLRGAGATGLAGVPARRGRIVRPLLGFSRRELKQVADELDLPYADDPANRDRRHLRSRIRHDLIPLLEAEYNPEVRSALARTAEHARLDDEALNRTALEVPVVADAGAFLLPIPVLATVPDAVAARAVRRALRRLLDPYPGSASDVAAVLAVAAGVERRANLTGDLIADREGPHVAIYRPTDTVPDPVRLEIPGTADFGVHTVRMEPSRRAAWVRRGTSAADSAAVGSEVVLRAAETGERIEIEGGSKPVRDALAEAGVPVRLRPAWPLVDVGGKIVAVAGVRVAQWARPRGDDVMMIGNERKCR